MTPTTAQENLPAIVDFHGAQLLSKRLDNGSIVVAMKPVVLGMGLDWASQYVKLQAQKEKFSCCDITMTAVDGKDYLMLSIPLTKMNGWLFSINPVKIPDMNTRAMVETYQEECFQVLHDYWWRGEAVNPRGQGQIPYDPSMANRYLQGLNVIDRSLKADKRLGIDLYEARVNAVNEATRVSGVDFSNRISMIPRQGNRSGTSVPGIAHNTYRGDDLADKFFSALKNLPPKQREKCVYVREDFIFVRMPLALKLIEARGLHIAQADLTPMLKKHEAFMKASAVVHARFGEPKSFVVRVWSFSHAIFAGN